MVLCRLLGSAFSTAALLTTEDPSFIQSIADNLLRSNSHSLVLFFLTQLPQECEDKRVMHCFLHFDLVFVSFLLLQIQHRETSGIKSLRFALFVLHSWIADRASEFSFGRVLVLMFMCRMWSWSVPMPGSLWRWFHSQHCYSSTLLCCRFSLSFSLSFSLLSL